ncbi:hypothetical protein N836_24135 [Leptolyngbya sp. Heron Island J]|uniref:hypothetical protein n=1 Tax=Leptolyngbya sp. Heron Island J TaxID=1385935 RepID=UPI0003B95174|nr:hypothetical protein [Leptolyngbya sp. Heron Island J]ESA32880.1 hypothetical protein N836_24135 [Leptolyngbya sp. Heron Island J]
MSVLKQDQLLKRSDSHCHMIKHLTGPFQAGALDVELEINSTGQVPVEFKTREPLILAAPKSPLGTESLRLKATLPNNKPVVLTFAPYTEAGAFLPLYRPTVDTATQMAAKFTLKLELERIESDGSSTSLAANDIAVQIEVHLIEGILGRLIYVMGAEKQRIRRQARELTAMHVLSLARDNALDQMGAELGVLRFAETLIFQPPPEIDRPAIFNEFNFGERHFGPGSPGDITTELDHPEPDDEYRQRLGIYRRWMVSNRQQVLTLLNSSGTEANPNQGLISALGFDRRFQVIETDKKFAVAIHLVASGDPDDRTHFLNYIRATYLIWPGDTQEDHNIHDARYLPTDSQTRINQLRQRLRKFYTFAPKEAIAPVLATVLDRVGRCRRALGINTPLEVRRSQDSRPQADGGSSLFELGLGVEISPISAAELTQMAERLGNFNFEDFKKAQATPDEPNPQETASLLESMTPRPASADPDGRWFLEACGINTIHPITRSGIYLSHLLNLGTVIIGPAHVALGSEANFEVAYTTPDGIALDKRRFRWYAIPLWPKDRPRERIKGRGHQATFKPPAQAGLSALVAVVQTHEGETDPYTFKVELPDDTATLNLQQYEFLMNLLQQAHPLGIGIDTTSIRQDHVITSRNDAIDLTPFDVSETYRQFRRRRYRGETTVSQSKTT